MNPKINFKISKEAEKENIKFFLTYKSRSGQDSFLLLVRCFPELQNLRELSQNEQEKVIDEFVDRKYEELKNDLERGKDEVGKAWDYIKERFFKAAVELFDGHNFPKKEYTAFLTIFLRFRYDLEKGFFYTSKDFKQTSATLITMHELLHFLFYDYWDKNFKGKLDDNTRWDLSEILNVFILMSQPFRVLGGQDTVAYPAHKEKYEKLKPLWENRKNMKDFIEKSISKM